MNIYLLIDHEGAYADDYTGKVIGAYASKEGAQMAKGKAQKRAERKAQDVNLTVKKITVKEDSIGQG